LPAGEIECSHFIDIAFFRGPGGALTGAAAAQSVSNGRGARSTRKTAMATMKRSGRQAERPVPAFGNPDLPPQGAINADNKASLTDPGPQNPVLGTQFPSAQFPPPTDVSDMPMFWASFNNAPKRVQNGGWARQVTQFDFAIAEEISGVDMRLTAGGIREMHWHLAAEWGYVSHGACRVTVLDEMGRAYVADVSEGDIWYFPAGLPHSLQGLGPDGCEFLLCFDDGKATEYNTLLLTDWLAHTPPEILAANFGMPAETFASIPLNQLYIFQGEVPGPLAADRAAAAGTEGAPPYPFTFSLKRSPGFKKTGGGEVRVADSNNFHVSKTIAAALVTLAPGALREMHWHPNGDEWQYWLEGHGRMTLFDAGPKAVTQDFHPGDIGYVKRAHGHYVQNVGDGELQFLEVFRSSYFADVSLTSWLTHTPPAMVAQHLGIDEAVIAKLPRGKPEIMPL
jgi:oxalate decarboxylase